MRAYGPKIGKSALRELQKKLLDLQKEGVNFEGYEIHHDIDIKLHSLFLEEAGNEAMKKLMDGLNSRVMYIRMVHSPERFQPSVAKHLRIISGLLDVDPAMASNAMRRHLANGREDISSM